MKRRDYLTRVQTLQAELALARVDLARVTGQRDELRRVIGDVRSYARQEAERAVVDNLSRREAAEKLARTPPPSLRRVTTVEPAWDYVWPDPGGEGWVDAWNGWYPTERQAREEGAAGQGRPRVLKVGEGLVDEEEMDRRLALVEREQNRMRPTVALAAHLSDPEPACSCLQDEPRTWASCPVHPPGRAVEGQG